MRARSATTAASAARRRRRRLGEQPVDMLARDSAGRLASRRLRRLRRVGAALGADDCEARHRRCEAAAPELRAMPSKSGSKSRGSSSGSSYSWRRAPARRQSAAKGPPRAPPVTRRLASAAGPAAAPDPPPPQPQPEPCAPARPRRAARRRAAACRRVQPTRSRTAAAAAAAAEQECGARARAAARGEAARRRRNSARQGRRPSRLAPLLARRPPRAGSVSHLAAGDAPRGGDGGRRQGGRRRVGEGALGRGARTGSRGGGRASLSMKAVAQAAGERPAGRRRRRRRRLPRRRRLWRRRRRRRALRELYRSAPRRDCEARVVWRLLQAARLPGRVRAGRGLYAPREVNARIRSGGIPSMWRWATRLARAGGARGDGTLSSGKLNLV